MASGQWDILDSKEVIKMAHGFFSGREIIDEHRVREPGKKIVSVVFPFPELVYAMDAIPLFLLRYDQFTYKGIDTLLKGITRITRLFGWNAIDQIVKLAYFTRAGTQIVDTLLSNLLESLTAKQQQLVKTAETEGFPIDSCYSSRQLYGSTTKTGYIADANMDLGYRCPFLYKLYESQDKTASKMGLLLDVPTTTGAHAEAAVEADLMEMIEQMERLTGNRFSEEKLAMVLEKTNAIKDLYKELLFDICAGSILPQNPLTFSEIQALLTYTFIDCNSNINVYRANFKNMVAEMRKKIDSGKGFDVSGMPKILYVPMFNGLEQGNLKSICSLGGYTVFADWEILGFLEKVDASNNVVKQYVRHFLRVNQFLGTDNATYADSIVRTAKRMRCDGVLFQNSFACKNITPALKVFKDKARQNDIPVVETSFNNIGENVEQNKTRIEAFMEMIKE